MQTIAELLAEPIPPSGVDHERIRAYDRAQRDRLLANTCARYWDGIERRSVAR